MLAEELDHLDHAEALALLRRTCADGDRSPVTVLNLAIAEDHAGSRERARRMMRELTDLLPAWDEPPLRLAESLRREGLVGEAERTYAAVLEINPRRQEALVARAALLIQRGDATTARSLLLRCIGINPLRAEAWDALGIALQLTGDMYVAESAFGEAHRLEPTVLEYALHRVAAAQAVGKLEAELARLEVSAAENPTNPVLLAAIGTALERLGRRPEAIDAVEAALTLAPDSPWLVSLAGGLLARADRLREASTLLKKAVELRPASVELRNGLATLLMRMHRHAAARQELEAALELAPNDPCLLCNLANALVCLGRHDEAERAARQAISIDPASAQAHRILANALPYRAGIGGRELLSVLQGCAALLPRGPAYEFPNSPDPGRKLRIGLLSGSLRSHPVGWLTVAGFETLDPAGFEIACLGQAKSSNSIARRFQAVAREWHEIELLDDQALISLARQRQIDVLIDLGGNGEAGRMFACAHRLAPVQVKWVGMQTHSTGLPEMDWIISDRWETPPELERFYSERILRLPDGYVCYSPPTYAPDVTPLPAATRGFVTFGCFNNLAKITPTVLGVWAEVLRRVPDARLVLKTHQFSEVESADRINAAFAELGIAPDRIELRGSSEHREFLAQYNDIDLVLDPFPYSGGLTTCEALWMGVPTVTLPGETFSSRHSLSHLSNVGLHDWAARSEAHYVELAVARAGDVAALTALRAGLRAQVKASPLCDAPRFGRGLGEALRFAWREWCAGR